MRGQRVRKARVRTLAGVLVAVLVAAAVAAAIHRHGSMRTVEVAGPSGGSHRHAAPPDVCRTCQMALAQLPAPDPPAPAGVFDERSETRRPNDGIPPLSAGRPAPQGRAPPAVLS